MSTAGAAAQDPPRSGDFRGLFVLGFLGLTISSAWLSIALPLSVAFAGVFLFAGPHNWFELRYALGRLPARAGRLRGFFVASGLGIVGLAGAYAALPYLRIPWRGLEDSGTSIWSTAFLFWIALLVWLRSHTNPRFDGGWVWPVACLLTAVAWLTPYTLPLSLVFLHPLMALWLLDLELARSHPTWQKHYRCVAISVPIAIIALWWQLNGVPALPGTDQISLAFGPTVRAETLTDHVGAGLLPRVSPYFLVAAHTFLELVHYGVWVVLMPLVGLNSWPWQTQSIPVSRRSPGWSRAVAGGLLIGILLVGVLWVCFSLDYETTRRIYFTVAMLHVLAEVPFLLRMV